MCLKSFLVLFLFFEIHPHTRSVLEISPYYSLYKMANFATFQKRVIFRMLTLYLGVFLRRITVTWLKSRFFLHLKRQPRNKPGPFWPFCHNLAIFATFQNRVIISNIDCVVSRFSEQNNCNVIGVTSCIILAL